ncbi:hypothetical protein [Aurantimicrobium minutum]|uniref:hypothetical protein n=1 Tax=Aurantimicrobium minutum TaxID=708131 RepID=UPI0024770480|nr:hypothetical protein [Aurantimicrobium minutum]MDH6208378.1 hypothetical protein [Aurantimicrobium minutum]
MATQEGSSKKLGTVLVLSTYPIHRPRHGGQLRSAALMVEYEKAFRKVVRTAVFNSSVYTAKEYGRTDIPSPADLTQEIVKTPELEAWILGESPISSVQVRERVTQLIQTIKPDFIVFEQPFLYLGMKQLLSDLQLEIPLIYSSHNIESVMMREIFESQQLHTRFEKELNQLETEEQDLAVCAIGTISVSEEDALMLSKWGAENVLVQGNGASELKSSRLKRLRVRRVMKKLGVSNYALYVGSSHRPNIEGFIELLGTRLGYLPSDSMIFLAGDIARGLQPEVDKIDPVWGKLMWARVFNWDRVSEKTLSALIEEASCILLPMTSGGGSNLKTAEALLAGKRVIATPIALRGFTKYATHQLMSQENANSEGYRADLVDALKRTTEQQGFVLKPLIEVKWASQLSELPQWFVHISGKSYE